MHQLYRKLIPEHQGGKKERVNQEFSEILPIFRINKCS